MAKDLFKDDLQTLQYSDIELFTNINGPEDLRPPEGVRIDYKENIPNDIGDIVTAFANTYSQRVQGCTLNPRIQRTQPFIVIPAKAGIQCPCSGFPIEALGNDRQG